MCTPYAILTTDEVGTRLRPICSDDQPKPFLPLLGPRTMLQATFDRIEPLVPAGRVFVTARERYADLVAGQLPDLPRENILIEPPAGGHAACVGLAAARIARIDPRAVMLTLPSDHVIREEERFRHLLAIAFEAASDGEHLVTLGLTPIVPSSELRILEVAAQEGDGESDDAHRLRRIERFIERPDREAAEEFLATGRHFWASGSLIARVDRILAEIRDHVPPVFDVLEALADSGGESVYGAFASLEGLSIERDVLAAADRLRVLPADDIGWSAVDSLDALRELRAFTGKPWGHEILWALTPDYAGKVLHIDEGESLSLQYHETKEETIRVLAGKLRFRWAAQGAPLEERILEPGERFHIPPGLIHQMEAVTTCDVLEVSTPHILDVVRLEDRYGRSDEGGGSSGQAPGF